MTCCILLGMDLTSARQYATDVRSHHSLKISCLRMARLDGVGLLASCFFIHDQRFSMGLRSGSYLAILKQKLMPAMAHAKITRFLQDGAPCHQAKAVKECLALKNMAVMNWPGNSPDLNPIENLWLWMKKQLVNRPTPSSLAILRQEISKLWCERTSVVYCRCLSSPCPRGCSRSSTTRER